MRPLASAAGATAAYDAMGRMIVGKLSSARARHGFYAHLKTMHKAHVLPRKGLQKRLRAGAPHKASVQDLVQLVERREELGRHLLVRPVGRVDALELLLLVGALRVEQQVQEKHNQ